MIKLVVCLVIFSITAGCTRTVYDGSEKAYGMHPEWTDRQPSYLPADPNGDPPDN